MGLEITVNAIGSLVEQIFLEGGLHQFSKILIFFIGVIFVKPITYLPRIKFPESAQEPVPDGENRAVIAIGIGLFPVMVHFVHIGGYKYPTYGAVQPAWKTDIGMGELGGNDQQGLKDHYGIHR